MSVEDRLREYEETTARVKAMDGERDTSLSPWERAAFLAGAEVEDHDPREFEAQAVHAVAFTPKEVADPKVLGRTLADLTGAVQRALSTFRNAPETRIRLIVAVEHPPAEPVEPTETDLGDFKSIGERTRLIAAVDLSDPKTEESFVLWQDSDGSRDGLLAIVPHTIDSEGEAHPKEES